MHDFCVLGGADVRPHRTGMPAVHLLDDAEGTIHIGILHGGEVVGVVSGFAIHPTGAPDRRWLQLCGPFGMHGEELVDELVARARTGVTLWAETPRPRLEPDGHGRYVLTPLEPEGYGIDSIQVLEGLEAVRLRPGMYVGSTGARGVEALVLEAVCNVVDEHLAGHAQTLEVDLQADGTWTVANDGRGLSVDDPPHALETLVGTLFGGCPDNRGRAIRYGLGLPILNALSELLLVTVDRAGSTWEQLYRRGRPVTPLLRISKSDRTGTTLRFRPDREIFNEMLSMADFEPRLRQVATLNPRLRILAQGRNLSMPGGLLARARELAHAPVVHQLAIEDRHDDVDVRLAVVWTAGDDPLRLEMHTNQLTTRSGTPVDAVQQAFSGRDGGVIVVGAIELADLLLAGSTREEVVNPEAGVAVREVLRRALADRGADQRR